MRALDFVNGWSRRPLLVDEGQWLTGSPAPGLDRIHATVRSLEEEPIPADVHSRLGSQTTPVAGIGCGVGWAAIELAKAYPLVRVEGFDIDLASIESAQRNAKEHHVHDRVTFHLTDTATWQAVGSYDLILFLECVHDFWRPVEALAKKIQPTNPTVAPSEAK
jgi:2-polyprenyl-3-methyl-5-hydroxy-6-metoxy-1,4-benzoquinol methylase